MALGHTELLFGQGRRNYATWSTVNKSNNVVLSGGNLTWAWTAGGGFGSGIATIGKSSDKWLWEVFINSVGTDGSVVRFGIANFIPTSANTTVLGQSGSVSSIGWRGSPWAYSLNNNGTTSTVGSPGTAYAANQYYLVAMDMDNKTLTIYRDGTLVMNAVAIPSAGSATWYPACSSPNASGSVSTANFGQLAWSSVNETARNTLVAAGYKLGVY